jgi:hypothetical protein
METKATTKKDKLVLEIRDIIQTNFQWCTRYATRAWCTSIAFKIVDLLEANGVKLDE